MKKSKLHRVDCYIEAAVANVSPLSYKKTHNKGILDPGIYRSGELKYLSRYISNICILEQIFSTFLDMKEPFEMTFWSQETPNNFYIYGS